MLEQLKEEVCEANLELKREKLIIDTWGNASGIDRQNGLVVIKPSGVAYEKLRPQTMVVVDLNGRVVEGDLRPSSDTPTHICLYRNFPKIGGVVHTHSSQATAWAQAGLGIPCYGTTHADYFYGTVPCTRPLTPEEVVADYELNTGRVIVERFAGLNYEAIPAVLVAQHGPFSWGKDPLDAVHHSVILEEVARMGLAARALNPDLSGVPLYLLDKHFLRKHGQNAYYGQSGK